MSTSRQFKVAIVGATGLVGETMVKVLEERKFPVSELHLLASNRSLGKAPRIWRQHPAGPRARALRLQQNRYRPVFPGSGGVARVRPQAAAAGCIVIDNTSEFRYYDDVPLIVPEVNPHAIVHYKNRGIIANPNCSTIQLVVALKPIHDAVGIERINMATYQSVSGAGREACR